MDSRHVVGHPGLGERYRDEMLQVAHREIAAAAEAAVAAEPAQAACPVVIVRGDREGDDGPVVVGIDGSPVSEAALAFAFDAATARGGELVVLHSWWVLIAVGRPVPGAGEPLVRAERSGRPQPVDVHAIAASRSA